jgi:L-seryl-tRNA(Ser) seleniumtransferase
MMLQHDDDDPRGAMAADHKQLYRTLPKVDVLLADPEVAALPHLVAKPSVHAVLDALRKQIKEGNCVALPKGIPALVVAHAARLLQPAMVPVLNATGVVLHTNIGRAVWSSESAHAFAACMSGYCNLELKLEDGKRGGRLDGIREKLRLLTGAEDALIVNNGAAALMLTLTALAHGKTVAVSRGELVEIGGSFRIPDVIAAGGAHLLEVGSTNRTHLHDYANIDDPNLVAMLRVHPSNFHIVGFTGRPTRGEFAALAHEKDVLAIEDLGSGALSTHVAKIANEPTVRDVLNSGMDLITFSGDKLLGGPQAGVIVGRADLIEKLRTHPMARSLRVGKGTIAAFEATLIAHMRDIDTPTAAMLGMKPDAILSRAQALTTLLNNKNVSTTITKQEGVIGGGSSPNTRLDATVVAVSPANHHTMAQLRAFSPPIIARLHDGTLLLDVRTLRDEELELVAIAVSRATRKETP